MGGAINTTSEQITLNTVKRKISGPRMCQWCWERVLGDEEQNRIGIWGRDICTDTWKVRRGSHSGMGMGEEFHSAWNWQTKASMGEESASFLPPLENSPSTAPSLVLCAVGTSGSLEV